MKFKLFTLFAFTTSLSACQIISPIFVDYYDVRMDVAKWINRHQLLSMQQKRSLVQLTRAQQKLYNIESIPEEQKIQIARENSIAMYCAELHLSQRKIKQLQNIIFDEAEQQLIFTFYDQKFPKIKLDINNIQCD
ncbi:hypothetical protein [Acinetobacter silvestris]|uniref:Lipoprotein n=1 Tax=Acinetobacter silvestris TaxID=1977882 RepID=A0A1Y3CLP5_9GAMM|nr:hypothetical protein [Acinetobacter silvestris]OTG66809.1 hypothetical protein B9T28_05630 [Acinetobacter silvestris]